MATHLAPPFIKVDTQKCSAQKCPPHITTDALQRLSMTAPYYNFKQLTVKRPAEQPDLVTELTKVYAAFSNELWLCIMGEVLLVWLLFLATEPYNDDCLEGGWTLYFDCFYWSFTTSARQRRSTTRSSLTAKTSGLRGRCSSCQSPPSPTPSPPL